VLTAKSRASNTRMKRGFEKDVTKMDTLLTPVPESDFQARTQRIQDNLQMMRTYFDALFGKDLNVILDMLDENIEWLIVPTGDTLKGKAEIAKLAPNHWAASPDRIKTLVNLFAGEEYASLEYRTAGTLTNQADFPSIKFEATGKKYEFQCSFVFHIANGKIDRVHEYFDMETVKRQLGAENGQQGAEFVKAFTAAFTSDDIESFYKLIDPDCEWVIVATGETFRGLDQIKQLTVRSVAARTHDRGLGIKPTNIFTNAEGTSLCWEYMHTAVVTDKWPSSTHRPAPGTKIAVPIVLIGEIHQCKLVKVREFFDLLTATEPGVTRKLYS
jgi:ketosteroid isomerase-like protein